MKTPIYLDYNATTPVDPAVADTIGPWLRQRFGNPSSNHCFGVETRQAVERAREQVAGLIDASPAEILFTSCATEANNLAIQGVAQALRQRGAHLVTSVVEHPSVLEPCRRLAARGWSLSVLPVDSTGRVDPESVAGALREETVLVSIMLANNETGTLQPIEEIARITRERGILLHVDAAQAVGRIPVSVQRLDADLLTLAGHKFHAPKGIGALYLRRGTPIEPLLAGGGQEQGLRPGTENVPFIAGLGEAARLARDTLMEEQRRIQALRDRLHQILAQAVPGLALNGHPNLRLPGTLNLSFPGVDGQALLARCAGQVAASTGSACHANEDESSGVLGAMGLDPERRRGAVRLSLGRFTTQKEIERAGHALVQCWKALHQEETR